MWWYEDRTECTFSGTAYPTNMTTRMWPSAPESPHLSVHDAWELPECQMDAIPDQGRGNILGLGECIAISFGRVLTDAVLRQ